MSFKGLYREARLVTFSIESRTRGSSEVTQLFVVSKESIMGPNGNKLLTSEAVNEVGIVIDSMHRALISPVSPLMR